MPHNHNYSNLVTAAPHTAFLYLCVTAYRAGRNDARGPCAARCLQTRSRPIRAGLRLHVFSLVQLCEHLALDAAFFAAHLLRFAGLKRRAVRGLLSPDVLLLTRAQPAANAARHLFACRG